MNLDVVVIPLKNPDGEKEGASDILEITMVSNLSGIGFMGTAPLRALGVPTSKTETHTLDGAHFETYDHVLGKFAGRMWICTVAEVEKEGDLDEYLREGWDNDRGEGNNFVIRLSAKSLKVEKHPWHSEQVWGLRGKMYTGRVKMCGGPDEAEVSQIVYDYVG
jgi:hypothetical protein